MVNPSRNLEDVGFFTPDGEIELDSEEQFVIEGEDAEEVEHEQTSEDVSVGNGCQITFMFFAFHRIHFSRDHCCLAKALV